MIFPTYAYVSLSFAPLNLNLFRQVKSVKMAAKAFPFPLEHGTNFAEKCVPGGSKPPAANQRNVLELLFHVKGLHLKDNQAEVCKFCVLLGNYLQGVSSTHQCNLQLDLYRRVQVLEQLAVGSVQESAGTGH